MLLRVVDVNLNVLLLTHMCGYMQGASNFSPDKICNLSEID